MLIMLNIVCLIISVGLISAECFCFQAPVSPPSVINVEVEPQIVVPEIPPLILEINKVNSLVTSFSCDHISIQTWYKGLRTKSQGELYYEPENKFRFFAQSVMGEECDMGSNDNFFWFWSKRMKEPGLFYARYEDFHKTRLKTPLNPMWLRSSLGLDPIDLKNANISETPKEYIIIQPTLNSIGDRVFAYTIVDKSNKCIRGFSLLNSSNEVIASVEITRSKGTIDKILYSWNEEDRTMQMNFQSPSFNHAIDRKFWDMPINHSPKIDMGKD